MKASTLRDAGRRALSHAREAREPRAHIFVRCPESLLKRFHSAVKKERSRNEHTNMTKLACTAIESICEVIEQE